ncbi:MACPF domain-containing protein At4g24290-like isoform X3 [Trifolium pratense]|uniref:MACPF domain-containing protein At4g24290-like isoform X3 n=1 Tax=Trifolium pratense TaxID=57577 RepID=UPI001E691883|nr:MACPF domain-containing protein At4g24290-like isoform X3 [Trifolium pratense]
MAQSPSVSGFEAAQKAINTLGLGFDLTQDINFDNCKTGSRLILIDGEQCRHLEIPGGVSIPDVSNSIRCVGGESIRINSEVLTLQQMLQHFNHEMRLDGRIASGHFCASFGLNFRDTKELASIIHLAYDGWFIKRYAVELEKYHDELYDHVKESVPSSWDPEAMARFIERFGTHVIVGVSMGGKDVLYVRQEDTSDLLDPAGIQKLLTETASIKFMDSANNHGLASQGLSNIKKNLFEIHIRRGGSSQNMNHSEWLDTIDSEPDVISMHLLPLTTLLSGITGYGFVAHAINLYLRYKPPIEDLRQFLEFQLPREWSPVYGKIHLDSNWKHEVNNWLRLSILGSKLYINTIPVDVGNRPVTGLRLQLEGKRSNRLAIHLQHLASLPKSLSLADSANAYSSCDSYSCKYHKKLKWNCFSYVCTAPIESDDSLSIVTGAQLQVEKKCLLLGLHFSKVIGATLQKPPEWDQSSNLGQSRTKFWDTAGHMDHPMPGDETVSPIQYSDALPAPVRTPKLQKYVDKMERVRGPADAPGYWAVSGAKLSVHNGKIYLFVKYSLLSFVI